MHEFDELTAEAAAAFEMAINAVAAHRAGQCLEPIGDIILAEAGLLAELDEAREVDIAALPPPDITPDTTAAPTPAPSATKTRRISLRVPAALLTRYQNRARLTGTRYQTLINRVLKSAAASW